VWESLSLGWLRVIGERAQEEAIDMCFYRRGRLSEEPLQALRHDLLLLSALIPCCTSIIGVTIKHIESQCIARPCV
jgi:hypothetical protein